MQKKIVKLCGAQGCCPMVKVTRDQVTITDDQGGSVQLTTAQWQELLKKFAAKK